MEEDASLREGTLADLEGAFGTREWDARAAHVEEGEGEERDLPTPEVLMSYRAIGAVMGVGGGRIQQIERGALEKLRQLVSATDYLDGAFPRAWSRTPMTSAAEINAALKRCEIHRTYNEDLEARRALALESAIARAKESASDPSSA